MNPFNIHPFALKLILILSHGTGLSKGNTLLTPIREFSIQISAGAPGILTEVFFHGFCYSQVNTRIVRPLGHDRFLECPFLFIIDRAATQHCIVSMLETSQVAWGTNIVFDLRLCRRNGLFFGCFYQNFVCVSSAMPAT
jgi:hypothetical protein